MTPRRVLAFVRRFPGSTCEKIAGELGVLPALMSVVLLTLRAEGRLTSEGRTRGTRWYAAAQ